MSNNMSNKYVKSEPIPLKGHPEFNEKWVQDLIANDPSILGLGDLVLSVCQKTPLSELSCHDPPHFPRQLQPNFVQEDASDRSGWGDWWWTGPDLRDAAIGRRSRLLGSGFKG